MWKLVFTLFLLLSVASARPPSSDVPQSPENDQGAITRPPTRDDLYRQGDAQDGLREDNRDEQGEGGPGAVGSIDADDFPRLDDAQNGGQLPGESRDGENVSRQDKRDEQGEGGSRAVGSSDADGLPRLDDAQDGGQLPGGSRDDAQDRGSPDDENVSRRPPQYKIDEQGEGGSGAVGSNDADGLPPLDDAQSENVRLRQDKRDEQGKGGSGAVGSNDADGLPPLDDAQNGGKKELPEGSLGDDAQDRGRRPKDKGCDGPPPSSDNVPTGPPGQEGTGGPAPSLLPAKV